MKLNRTLYQNLALLLLFIFSEKAYAQVCTTVISDPTVIIDFGSITPRATPLPEVPLPYQFQIADCPAEGRYAVRSNSFQCFNNLWQVLLFDHTSNDANGNFLLINALGGPSDVYIDTISLCSGRIFEGGAWVANILNSASCTGGGSRPDLTFSVYDLAGNLLVTSTTGAIQPVNPATWVNHKFRFTVPAGNGDVILKITDNALAGCGNDFAIDDITFSPCAGDVRTAFSSAAVQEIAVCQESQLNYLLTSTFTGYANPSIQWQVSYDGNLYFDIPGATNTSFVRTPTSWGFYYYRFTIFDSGSPACKVNSNAVKIDVNRSPFAQGTNYVFGCYGSDVLLGAAGGSFYHWTGPNGFVSDEENPVIPAVDFNDAGRYIVKVTTTEGCSAADTTNLTIYMGPSASVAFTQHTMCEGQSVQLNANPDPLLHYRWTPAESLSNDTLANPVATPIQTTTYIVKVYNETITCYDTASVKVIVWANPKANAGPDKFTYNQKPVVLQGSAIGSGISYIWSPSSFLNSPLFLKPQSAPLQTITYKLTVTSNYGCGMDTDIVIVKVIDSLLIPTAFTPNRDGLNDTWEIITFEKYPDAIVEVYNRWGQKVYSSTGRDYHPWDGKFEGQPAIPGSYVYYVRLRKNAELIKGILNVIE